MSLKLPKYSYFAEAGKFLAKDTEVFTSIAPVKDLLREALRYCYPPEQCYNGIYLVQEAPGYVKKMVEERFGIKYSDSCEAYTVVADESIKIYSASERGLFFGLSATLRLMRSQYLHSGFFYEAPVCAVRGAKVYLPGRDEIPFFKEFVDLLVHFRMNTIMIEIGGAMEYKRHPEINEGWVEYCKEIAEYSGKATHIQDELYPWLKNSIHVENGDGGFISQKEVKEIAEYCRERFIEIIPEVPSLSHCDYLLIRHPEIRERKNDDYADTYCPSNEASYTLLFDVLDEIIEVFDPREINIGHDESYTIGVCEKCREKDPVSIYVDDIKRIYGYLKDKGIKTIMWSEKLLDARTNDGRPAGGARKTEHYCETNVLEAPVPAIYPAIDKIPTDIEMLHWYWSLGNGYDEEYHARGLSITYGNFHPSAFRNWRKRMERGARGAIISNWSAVKAENLQRNGVLYGLALANLMYWEDDYNAEMAYTFDKQALAALFEYHYGKWEHGIRIIHSTNIKKEYTKFYDGYFIVHEEYDLGRYKIDYADGSEAWLPVEYGLNISCAGNKWEKSEDSIIETAFTTLPRKVKACGGYEVQYEVIYENPYPDKTVTGITFVKNPKHDAVVTIHGFEVF